MMLHAPLLSPRSDYWQDYKLPLLCEQQIKEVCQDILKKGSASLYREIYDAIYEIVLNDIEQEKIEGEINAYE